MMKVDSGAMRIRPDYAQALEQQVDHFLSGGETSLKSKLGEKLDAISTDGKFDLSKLSKEDLRELKRLEKASEDFEAHFIKGLMAQMRKVKFSNEQESGMGEFARETMDQAIAESASKGGSSIGIGRTVFLSMGDLLAKRAIGATLTGSKTESK